MGESCGSARDGTQNGHCISPFSEPGIGTSKGQVLTPSGGR